MTLEPLTTGTAWAPGSVGVVQILCGAVLLLLGRRLFWLLVGTVGFVLGFLLAETWIDAGGEALRWLVGLGLGLAAALVAVLVQRFAIAAAGTRGRSARRRARCPRRSRSRTRPAGRAPPSCS